MNLKITNHCQYRIQERGISVEDIKEAIRNPDTKGEAYEGRTRVTKDFENRSIEVIYYKDGFKDRKEEYFLVTAYYLN